MNKEEISMEKFIVSMMILFMLALILFIITTVVVTGKYHDVQSDLDYSLQTNRVFYEDYCINSSINTYDFYHKCDRLLEEIEKMETRWNIEREDATLLGGFTK